MGESRIEIEPSELDRLRAIEAAAARFDQAGASVNQMNAEQWRAYTELKAFFHGGIMGAEPKENEYNHLREMIIETVEADLRSNGRIRMALLGLPPQT